uniref:Uncharacterized protein n=1 Tax=Rhipicephalus zambeziensis TaxID=60191 RepID=A0A224YC48_9ACAR
MYLYYPSFPCWLKCHALQLPYTLAPDFPLVYHCETLWCTPPDWEIDRVLPTGGACRGAVWECLLRRELQLRLPAVQLFVRASRDAGPVLVCSILHSLLSKVCNFSSGHYKGSASKGCRNVVSDVLHLALHEACAVVVVCASGSWCSIKPY